MYKSHSLIPTDDTMTGLTRAARSIDRCAETGVPLQRELQAICCYYTTTRAIKGKPL